MKQVTYRLLTLCLSLSLLSVSACTNNQMGTVGGGALGGLAGYGLTGGSAVGTAVGAVGGGLVGNVVTR